MNEEQARTTQENLLTYEGRLTRAEVLQMSRRAIYMKGRRGMCSERDFDALEAIDLELSRIYQLQIRSITE